jgi:hypothetical protein
MKTTTYTQETDLARKSVMARQIAAALRYRMNNGQFNNKTLRLAASAAVNFMHEKVTNTPSPSSAGDKTTK